MQATVDPTATVQEEINSETAASEAAASISWEDCTGHEVQLGDGVQGWVHVNDIGRQLMNGVVQGINEDGVMMKIISGKETANVSEGDDTTAFARWDQFCVKPEPRGARSESGGGEPAMAGLIRPGDQVLLDWHDGSDPVLVLGAKPNALLVASPDDKFAAASNVKQGDRVWVPMDENVHLQSDIIASRATPSPSTADPFYELTSELNNWRDRLDRLAGVAQEGQGFQEVDAAVVQGEMAHIDQCTEKIRDALLAMSRSAVVNS